MADYASITVKELETIAEQYLDNKKAATIIIKPEKKYPSTEIKMQKESDKRKPASVFGKNFVPLKWLLVENNEKISWDKIKNLKGYEKLLNNEI